MTDTQTTVSLDEAWAKADSAQPKGGHLFLAAKPDGLFVAGTDYGDPSLSYAYGRTPVDALLALAVRLLEGQ